MLHWVSGSVSEARRAVDLGCFFSVNERMFSNPKGQALIRAIPENTLLTETDGPFVERDGKPVNPGDVGPVLETLGKVLSKTPEEVSRLVNGNLSRLVS